jgi:hypothetical protein
MRRLCPQFWALALSLLLGCSNTHDASPSGSAGSAGSTATMDASQAGSGQRANAPRFTSRNALAGACTLARVVDLSACGGLKPLLDCNAANCNLEDCVTRCHDYVGCLDPAEDACAVEPGCAHAMTQDCLTCVATLLVCTNDRCSQTLSCATPTQNGPCDKLKACCVSQRDSSYASQCSTWVSRYAGLLGDEGCNMLKQDSGFLKQYASDPVCALE